MNRNHGWRYYQSEHEEVDWLGAVGTSLLFIGMSAFIVAAFTIFAALQEATRW